MNFIKRLMFRQKILLLLLPAFLGLIYFAGINIVEGFNQSRSAASIEPLVKITAQNSLLVHELQKERGVTAGFLGSKGAQFGDLLLKQRAETTRVSKSRVDFLQRSTDEIDNREVAVVLEDIATQLRLLSQIRSQVDKQEITLKEALGYYSHLNSLLLSVSTKVAHIAKNGVVANQLQAYYNFLQGKERAGIERAVLSGTFAADQFTPGMYRRFIQLVTEQSTYLDNFIKASVPEQQRFYTQTMSHDAVNQVEKMRLTAFKYASTGGFGIDATAWFQQATSRINRGSTIK